MAHPIGEAPGAGGDLARVQRHGVARGAALRGLLWLALGGWVGSWGCFGLLVAPLVFQRLPAGDAGLLVGPILTALHLYGAGAGVALALLAALLGRGPLRVGLPLAMATACLYTHFGVSPAIAEISGQVFGPAGSEELAARFRHLHQLSLAIFALVSAGTLALVGLHALSDARGEPEA